MDQLKQVAISQVNERENYRQSYDTDFVSSIAGDMSSTGFKMEYPITVYANADDTYTVIDGHTRRQAALLASTYDLKSHKPVLPVWVVVKDKPNDRDFKLQQLAANEKRVDPDDMSKAIGYKQALDAGATVDDLCSATGHKDPAYITRRVDLLKLNDEIRTLVAKRQLSIMYAHTLTVLDSNFQRIALQLYRDCKSPSLDWFQAEVNSLLTKQSQCSLLDMALFNGKPIESVMAALKIERQKSRAELQAELDTQRKVNERNEELKRKAAQRIIELQKENDRIKQAANREIQKLRKQLAVKAAA